MILFENGPSKYYKPSQPGPGPLAPQAKPKGSGPGQPLGKSERAVQPIGNLIGNSIGNSIKKSGFPRYLFYKYFDYFIIVKKRLMPY